MGPRGSKISIARAQRLNRQKNIFFQKLHIWGIIPCKYLWPTPNSQKVTQICNFLEQAPSLLLDFPYQTHPCSKRWFAPKEDSELIAGLSKFLTLKYHNFTKSYLIWKLFIVDLFYTKKSLKSHIFARVKCVHEYSHL